MQSIAERYGVTGYPTLKLVRNGEVSDWKGIVCIVIRGSHSAYYVIITEPLRHILTIT